MLLTILTAAAMMPQGPGSSTAPIVINELCYDDTGTDDKEFVELYNRSNAAVDISGWTLVGSDPTGANTTYTIPPGTTLAPGGFWVVGLATVPNVNQVIAATPSNFENDNEAIDLVDLAANIVDSVAWETGLGSWGPHPREGTGLWSQWTTQDATPQTYQRWVDGYDSNDNGRDFAILVWTPGAANSSANTVSVQYGNQFDGAPGTLLTADFNNGFVSPRIADPAAIVNNGVNVISVPASPQGGNVCIWHDPTGGGNAGYLKVPTSEDFLVETYVYVLGGNPAFAAPGLTGEAEYWTIGVTGTIDPGSNPADVASYFSQIQCTGSRPGSTGVAWVGIVQQAQTSVYLVDLNNGGAGPVILGGPIVATPGVNDGWQRLRLRMDSGNLTANFGGTFGANDGTVFNTSGLTPYGGTVYFGYRECIVSNLLMTPLITDNLVVWTVESGNLTFAGTGSPVSAGVPTIGTSGGSPEIANAAFAITGGNFGALGLGGILVKIGGLLPLGVQLPGAQPGCELWVGLPEDIFGIAFADGLGDASYGLPLPADNVFAGVTFGAQWLVADPSLPYALQLGSSQGMEVTIGN